MLVFVLDSQIVCKQVLEMYREWRKSVTAVVDHLYLAGDPIKGRVIHA